MLIGGVLAVLVSMIVAIPACKLKKAFLAMLTIAFGQIVQTLLNTMRITGKAQGIWLCQ